MEIGEVGGLNPAVVRRLVALELGDISVPGNPRILEDTEDDVSLHCRVIPEDGVLRVEVWERGELAGARRVSLQGTPALVARRVALAAAELARRLSHARQAEARRLEREAQEALRLAEAARERAGRERLGLTARARALTFLEGAYLAGPSVGAQLNRDHPLRLELGMAWMAGQVTALEGAPTWSTLELDVRPSWVRPLTPRVDVAFGVPLAAGVVHTQSGVTVDGLDGQRDTWMARGGLEARIQPRLSPHLRLDLGLGGGWVLRGLPLDRTSAAEGVVESRRLGGPWGELSLGVLLD